MAREIVSLFKDIEEINKYILKHKVPDILFKELENCKAYTDKLKSHELSYLLEHHNNGENSYQVSLPFNLIEGSFLQSYLIYLGQFFRSYYENIPFEQTMRSVFMRKNHNHFDMYDFWINYAEKGSKNTMHTHVGNLSGVIYFTDCEGSPINFENNFSYKASKGDLLIFPSVMKHGVEEHQSDKTRITFAFNLYIETK